MDPREAAALLEEASLVPFTRGPIPYVKELVQKCLDAGIPAMAGCLPGAGKG